MNNVAATHNCAAVDVALDAFLVELALYHEGVLGHERTPGVSDREQGINYLRQMAAEASSYAQLRDEVEATFRSSLFKLQGGYAPFLEKRREIGVLSVAFDLLMTLCADLIDKGGVGQTVACAACGRPSLRRYCDGCARELNLEGYENPHYGQNDPDGESESWLSRVASAVSEK